METSRIRTWLRRAGAVAVAAMLIVVGLAAAWPAATDPLPAPAAYGAGARSVSPSETGLERAFPPLNTPDDNPSTPEKVALGRMLFFDPVLSERDDLACATCHHPDLGFADGLPLAVGAGGSGVGPNRSGGTRLTRHTPQLWNVGYARSLFWDGRADSLEDQALTPLTHADEMGSSDAEELVAELEAIPEYRERFGAAFPDEEEPIRLENVVRALAAFQRTLISNDSPFDRYAAGDRDALTPAQIRGLTLFRSAATRCFECHPAPTFATDTFRVIGVPEWDDAPHDPGRAGVADDGADGAFRVPTLRNVALSPPYMHNGMFETLDEVIEFYAGAGGRAYGTDDVDPFLLGFDLSEQEKDDLIAFLLALTDEHLRPAIPERVPSGLAAVPGLENPSRAAVAAANRDANPALDPPSRPRNRTVQPGESIQEAVDAARPGDTIRVAAGVYHERVVVDRNDIRLLGSPDETGAWPVLDGRGQLADGIIASGNGFELGFFEIRNYTDNGVLVEGVSGVHLHDLRTMDTGTYGLYPVQSTRVLVERVEAAGVNDAGIYAGQCVDVVIRDSTAYENVIGIEVENTVNAEVYGNHANHNALGIFIDLLPGLTSKVSLNTRVYDNLVEANNHENFAPQEATAALVPPGVGVLLLAADHVEVHDNVIRDHKSSGIGVFNLTIGFPESEIDVGPNPEYVRVYDNELERNGYDPDPFLRDLGIPGSDILWDGTGWDNRFDQPGASAFPPVLPGSGWPGPIYRLYWRALNALIGLVS